MTRLERTGTNIVIQTVLGVIIKKKLGWGGVVVYMLAPPFMVLSKHWQEEGD